MVFLTSSRTFNSLFGILQIGYLIEHEAIFILSTPFSGFRGVVFEDHLHGVVDLSTPFSGFAMIALLSPFVGSVLSTPFSGFPAGLDVAAVVVSLSTPFSGFRWGST